MALLLSVCHHFTSGSQQKAEESLLAGLWDISYSPRALAWLTGPVHLNPFPVLLPRPVHLTPVGSVDGCVAKCNGSLKTASFQSDWTAWQSCATHRGGQIVGPMSPKHCQCPQLTSWVMDSSVSMCKAPPQLYVKRLCEVGKLL